MRGPGGGPGGGEWGKEGCPRRRTYYGKAMVVAKRIDHSFASVVMERRCFPICILFFSFVLLMYNLSVFVNI